MKLGYSTWGMPTVPIDTTLSHLATLGFDAVEICVLPRFTTALESLDRNERRRISGLLAQHGLALSAVNYYTSLLQADETTVAHDLAQIKKAIDLAVEWTQPEGPPVVVGGIGGKPGDWPQKADRLLDRVNELGHYAVARGVSIALEHHVGAAIETPDQMVEFMEKVESPAIGANFDISHFNVVGVPIEEAVAKMIPFTMHTHIKDERGRAPDHKYLVPGEGEFDYVTYLQAMDAHGYDGVISVEISKMVQQRPDYDPLATAAQSYAVVARAFAEAGIQRE
jgi:sugar phosphate isomerase/epimerase